MHSFRIEDGKISGHHVVREKIWNVEVADGAILYYTTPSTERPKEPKNEPGMEDCKTGMSISVNRVSINAADGQIRLDPFFEDTFCTNGYTVVFGASSNTIFLVGSQNRVTGFWDHANGFQFKALTPRDSSTAKWTFTSAVSVDISHDKSYLGTVFRNDNETVLKIRQLDENQIVTHESFPNNGIPIGRMAEVRCIALSDREFCFNLDTTIVVFRVGAGIVRIAEAKQSGEKYTGVSIVNIETDDNSTRATCLLTPIDKKSVRQIELSIKEEAVR